MADYTGVQDVQQFMNSVLDYGIKKIYDKQISIATQRRAANREKRMQTADYIVDTLRKRMTQISVNAHGGAEVWSQIPLVMRFVDMKRNGNWQIYNRQVWGILYNEVYKDLSNKYRQWITFQMRLRMGKAFDPNFAAKVADQSYINITTSL